MRRSDGPLVDLVPGPYALTLSMSQHGDPECDATGTVCVYISLCGGAGGPSASSVWTVVRLDRSGDAITIRPEDPSATFRIDLQVTGRTLGGTASGQFRDGALQVSVAPAGKPSAVATGTVQTSSVAGKIDGQVTIGGYGCSNNAHTRTLVPR